MADFNYAKGRINDSIQYISNEMREFEKEYSSKKWDEYQNDNKLQKLMDRTVENILTALIEVGGTILAQKGIAAENYSEVLRKTAKLTGLNDSEQEILAKLANQRNRLAHRYLDFKWDTIKFYANNALLIKKLLSCILDQQIIQA